MPVFTVYSNDNNPTEIKALDSALAAELYYRKHKSKTTVFVKEGDITHTYKINIFAEKL